MTDAPRTGRWPVVAAVAPTAALLFSGAAAWASLTAPQPAPGPPEVTSAAEPAEVTAPDASAVRIAALQARLDKDRRRLAALRERIRAQQALGARQVAAGPAPTRTQPAPARTQAAPAPAKRKPASPPPPVDTTTGASG
jgi:hypothetical protein